MSSDDLENFEAERELQLAHEYQDVAAMFRYAVETERRFYLANDVKVTVTGESSRPVIEVEMTDAWVWDMYRKTRFVPRVRVLTFKDVNVEELTAAWSLAEHAPSSLSPQEARQLRQRRARMIRLQPLVEHRAEACLITLLVPDAREAPQTAEAILVVVNAVTMLFRGV